MGTLGPTSPIHPEPPSADVPATPPGNAPSVHGTLGAQHSDGGEAFGASGAQLIASAVLRSQSDGDEGQRTLREAALDALLPRAGRVVASKYRVDELMARGGMGAVYSATHVVTGKRVAIKWMLPTLDQVPAATERFVREAQATARIDHPNVVDIYDVGQESSSVYLVMELLQGETLRAFMRHGVLSPAHAIALLMPALRGVAAAHSHGVIHRDLKPDNIFLCVGPGGEAREAKVLDFGISKIASDARDNALTQSGTVLGTPYYMAPEQVRGLRDIDTRVDIYAFGVILYELLSGRRPFEADSYNGLILMIATERPAPLHAVNTDVPIALSHVVHKAMARSLDERFQSVADLARALEPFSAGVPFRLSQSFHGAALGSFSTPPGLATAPSSYPMDGGASSATPARPSGPGVSGASGLREPGAQHRTPAQLGKSALVFGLLVVLVGGLAAAVWLERARRQDGQAHVPELPAHTVSGAADQPAAPPREAPAGQQVEPGQQPSAPAPAGAPSSVTAVGVAAEAEPEPARDPAARAAVVAPLPSGAEPGDTRERRRRGVRPGQPSAPATGAAQPTETQAAPLSDTLPDDWDMRLRPVQPAPSSKPAGSLGADDF
jgi:eukaryotic-like serine/threonine-protein kinase